MSAPTGSGSPARTARSTRTAAVVAAVLVLGLVALLVGLVGTGGSGGSATATATSTASARPTPTGSRASAARAPAARRPSAPSTASAGARDPQSGLRLVALSALPQEAQATVALVDRGGPFPYAQDGVTFGNYEGVLPAHPRGWYREYTVRTPGERDRGPRRIVTGDDDSQVFYTGDHYATFVRVSR